MRTISKLVALSAVALSLGATSAIAAETAGQYIDDSMITTKVKSALIADAPLKNAHIEVTTDKGVVKLGGTVRTKSQESEAIKIANLVDGVKTVNDTIIVESTRNN